MQHIYASVVRCSIFKAVLCSAEYSQLGCAVQHIHSWSRAVQHIRSSVARCSIFEVALCGAAHLLLVPCSVSFPQLKMEMRGIAYQYSPLCGAARRQLTEAEPGFPIGGTLLSGVDIWVRRGRHLAAQILNGWHQRVS